MATFISHSANETFTFAASLAASVPRGVVLGLIGDLGAGKTQFVKGFAHGLGVVEPVLSPTFSLVHFYENGRLPLCHIDLYRLATTEQIVAAGLTEYFDPPGVTIVEWWDRWQGHEPPRIHRYVLETVSETERRIFYDPPGY